ncbi:MAG: glycosyltransferase family 2 protein [Phycisphaerales bacterium]|nr:glycosyltransferase family 2 protein [Phycisphaerales bacterium]
MTTTVVIPCFNHGRFIGDAVRSALAQEDTDVRVVIVDDGSDDGETPGACDALASERVTVIHQENTGLPGARNRGAAGATGEFLVFLDADDTIEPTFVRTLRAAIDADDISHAYCQERLSELGQDFVWRVPDWDPLLELITNLHPVTTLLRRDRFEAVGGFDETMTEGYEDWEFWIRLLERGWRGVRVCEPLFVWRRHSNETMIFDAVRKHERLYRQIMDRHPALFRGHADAMLVRMNTMLREFNVNWLDEQLLPIPLQDLWHIHNTVLPQTRHHLEETHRTLEATQHALIEANRALDEARQEHETVRAAYEAMGSVRLSRRVHRTIERLPRPVRPLVVAPLTWLRRLVQ